MKNDLAIIVSLDVSTYTDARKLARHLDPTLCRVKIGSELFTAVGPKIVEDLQMEGYDVFLDLKYNDIPSTVARAVASALELGVWMISLHTNGGRAMMKQAVETASGKQDCPMLIGATVLTSMDGDDLKDIGISMPSESALAQVVRLSILAFRSGLDGVICSGQEVAAIRRATGDDFCIVTPGIRLLNKNNDDHKRVATPEMAIVAGANYLVIGKSITGASDPLVVLADFNKRVSMMREEAQYCMSFD